MILLWGHRRLFRGIIRGTPAWNDPELDKQNILLINLCPNCTDTLTKLQICRISAMLGCVLWVCVLGRGSEHLKQSFVVIQVWVWIPVLWLTDCEPYSR